MTKQTNILNKLKANLKVLLPVCFALIICAGTASAEPTFKISESDIVGKISQTPTGNSQVYRQQPDNSAGGSTAFDREVRQFKRALYNTVTGKGPDILAYGKSRIGDGLSAGLDALDKGVSGIFDTIESELPSGFIKDILVTYNPIYQVSKFVTKAAVKIAKVATRIVFGVSNRECNKERMDAIYKSGCYACDIVTALIGSFMNACTYLYDVSKEAGHKILFVGLMLWIAFYILKQLSSLKNIEPMAMVNDLLVMAFKALGAYLVIGAGIDFFINYAVVPFMNFGAQFGIAMLASASAGSGLDISNLQLDSAYLFKDGPIPAHFLNQLQQYIAAVDYTVSTHLEIGHMLTCHATHAGAYDWKIARIPNIWIWLSGAFIWFSGFMMTLSVTYYLVDISFKLGFAIIALPITVGLWPFNVTKDRLASCFSIILKSAGILIFLAMTVAAGLALVSNALDVGSQDAMNASIDTILTKEMDGTEKMMTAIEDGDADYIDEQLAFWSFGWIIILFAYLFAIKLIGSTNGDYVNKFFTDKVFGDNNPMHMKLTQATDMAKKQAMKPVKFAGKIASHQASVGVGKGFNFVANKMFNKNKDEDKGMLDKMGDVKDGVDKLSKGDLNGDGGSKKKPSAMESAKSMTGLDPNKDKNAMKEKGSSGGGAGAAMEKSGQAMKEGGKQLQAAADNIDQSLSAADQGVKSGNQAVQGAAHAGTAASFGIAAPVTETAAAASAAATVAASASLNAGKAAAKAMKTMGKMMEKGGEIMEKSGKAVKKAEKVTGKIKKAGQTVNKFAEKAGKTAEKTANSADSSDEQKKQQGQDQQSQQQSDDLIGGAADKILGTGNKKK